MYFIQNNIVQAMGGVARKLSSFHLFIYLVQMGFKNQNAPSLQKELYKKKLKKKKPLVLSETADDKFFIYLITIPIDTRMQWVDNLIHKCPPPPPNSNGGEQPPP